MAKHSQHPQGSPASLRSGGGQAVVELCDIQKSGLTFWSRQHFEIGTELHIRLHREAIPQHSGTDEWVNLKGFVVESLPVRREDGTPSFRISLMLESMLMSPRKLSGKALRYQETRITGLIKMGLN